MKVVSSYDKIPNIDIHRFTQTLSNDVADDFSPMMPGVVAKKVSMQELVDEVEDGLINAIEEERNEENL